MHEASIAMSILDTVISVCRQDGYERVERVRLQIGRAAGVVPEALIFAFDAAKHDTVAAKAELVIDHVSVGGSCYSCNKDFTLPEDAHFVFECPFCGSKSFIMEQGREMQIVDMDVE